MKINENIYLVASGKMGFDWTHPSDCNVYLVVSGDELVLIDSGTGESVNHILYYIDSIGYSPQQLKKVFLTHIHADHAGGAAKIKEETGAEVYVHEKAVDILASADEDAIDLTKAKRSGFYPENYKFQPCHADEGLLEGQKYTIGNFIFNVLETPGHSRFDLSFIVSDEVKGKKYLFSGDTVLYGGKISIINTGDFNLKDLSNSIEKLSHLDCDLLLPGHNQPAMNNAPEHIKSANTIFENMGVPQNINL